MAPDPADERSAAIQVRDLAKRFGKTTALHGLTFAVGHGEILGLVGPDGAGKTTTMRVLAGILPRDRGSVVVDGVDVVRHPDRVKDHIGYLSQVFSMYGDLTVDENIRFFADLYGIPHRPLMERSEDLLRLTGLHPFRRRLADALSGGMKQKLALICTLIHRPRVLLLDEPTTGVDPVSRRDFWRIIHQMPSEGVTVLVSTPYMDEASRCGRVGLLIAGRLLDLAPPDDLTARTGAVLEVACDAPALACRALRAEAGILAAEIFGGTAHVYPLPQTPEWTESSIQAALSKAGLGGSVRRVPAGLEDAFVARLAAQRLAGEAGGGDHV